MTAGRPRTAIPEKKELIELGKELVKWAKEKNKKGENIRVRFCDWYTEKGFVRKQWEHMTEKPEFQWYHEQSRALLSLRYIDGTVNQSIAHRYLRMYDPELRDSEDLDHQEKIDRESKTQNDSTPPLQDNIDKDNEIMRLKHRISEMEKNADKCKTRSELL